MKYYGCSREDAAVDAAAAGYLTGKPGVALTVSAPGFLNGLTALAQATKNCFPLIMISGSSDRHIIDLDRGDYEGLDQYNVAKPFCKAAYRVDRAQDMGLAIARAVRTALSGRPSGVYLDLPAATVTDTVAQKSDANIYKVVDWTQVQSGPSCTQLLAWLGADVIKIERINTGDPTRNELLDIQDSWSLYYLQLNANKKSLTLNIKTDEGKRLCTT